MKPVLIIGAMVFAWFGLALGAMLTGTIATAAVPAGTKIPSDVAIVGTAPGMLIVRSDNPDYVAKLYKSGAAFVLPARRKTCLALQG